MENSDRKLSRGRAFLGVVLLSAIVAAVYGRSYRNEFIYDDHEVILAHPAPTNLADVGRYFSEKHFFGLPYYRPIVRTSLLVQKALHGNEAGPFHAFNIGLACGAGLLAWWILRHPAFGLSGNAGLLAALLFAVHPAVSSCVYPTASGRETLLPIVMILAAFGAWIRPGWWHALAIPLFACSLLGKEQAVVLPALFVLADLILQEKGTGSGDARLGRAINWMLRYLPVIVILGIYLFVRRSVLGPGQYQIVLFENRTGMLGILGPLWSFLFALQTTVLPTWDLSYEPRFYLWFSSVRLAISVAVLAGLGIGACRLDSKYKRAALFWFCWFVICQLPTANILRQQAEFDERYVALSLLAAPAVVGMLLTQSQRYVKKILALLLMIAIALAAIISFQRSTAFESDEAFADAWLVANPRSAEAWHFKGARLLQAGKVNEALPCVQAALDVKPDFLEAHHTLGRILARLGQYEPAAREFQLMTANRPEHFEAHSNLGFALSKLGRPEAAVAEYQTAIRLSPRNIRVRLNLAFLLLRMQKNSEAADQFREVLRVDPGNRDAREQLSQMGLTP